MFNFEREVNLSFEDAIKKEFQLRNDTIQELLVEQLMDTNHFIITNGRPLKNNRQRDLPIFHIVNAKDPKDYTSYSTVDFKDTLHPGDTIYKRKIANTYARGLRTEDLENHIIYYRTQNLGYFLTDKVAEYGFDTNRLRPILDFYLSQRNIHTPFYFHTSPADSLLNYLADNDSLKAAGKVVTKSFSTYKWYTYDEKYIRAIFEKPTSFVIREMRWILTGSLLLIVLVACCIVWLIKALFNEKRLAIIKNDFINNITHELKTPIATVSAAVEALEEQSSFGEPEKAARYLGYARTELQRLTRLVDNILNISLYEKSVLQADRSPFPVNLVLTEILERMRLATDKSVEYTFENNTAVEQLNADVHLFTQAFTNIVDNAIKYSGDHVILKIHCYIEGEFFCVQCIDQGEGIAASALPYVFQKFYRAPKTGHAVKGHGLGLSYVQEIMKAHGGKAVIKSVKDKGTDIILYWPL